MSGILHSAPHITKEELNNLYSDLLRLGDNESRLRELEKRKSVYLFTSQNLLDLMRITESIKSKISIISIVGPRLTDPKERKEEILRVFRYTEQKEIVEKILKSRSKALDQSKFHSCRSIEWHKSKSIGKGITISKIEDTGNSIGLVQEYRKGSTHRSTCISKNNIENCVKTYSKSGYHLEHVREEEQHQRQHHQHSPINFLCEKREDTTNSKECKKKRDKSQPKAASGRNLCSISPLSHINPKNDNYYSDSCKSSKLSAAMFEKDIGIPTVSVRERRMIYSNSTRKQLS